MGFGVSTTEKKCPRSYNRALLTSTEHHRAACVSVAAGVLLNLSASVITLCNTEPVEQTGISIAEGYQCKSLPNILINICCNKLKFHKIHYKHFR